MKNNIKIFTSVLLTCLAIQPLLASDFPTLYEGRIRPASSASALWIAPMNTNSPLDSALISHFETDQGPIKSIPLKRYPSQWVSLNHLEDASSNFSSFEDALFFDLQKKYVSLKNNYIKTHSLPLEEKELFFKLLQNAHSSLSTHHPFLLKLEALFTQFRPLKWVIFCYFASLIVVFFSPLSAFFFTVGFLSHLFFLITRSLILSRPPVTSMYETYLFVPFISSLAALPLIFFKNRLFTLAALIPLFFLTFAYFSYPDDQLVTLQPVLNSNFWLTIHVLLVVSSYGLFLLCGAFAHVLTILQLKHKKYLNRSHPFNRTLVSGLYCGFFALLVGTILGGLWAQASWGRFWDWDPKESWALISLSIYLVVIHLYRFAHITPFGLAIGSIFGLQSITFCWYGVNYLIGTGLHSYGFGSGGYFYYGSYFFLEIFFLLGVMFCFRKTKPLRLDKNN